MKRFVLIRSSEFLCVFSVAPAAVETGLRLTGRLKQLTTQRVDTIKAVKKLLTLRQKAGGAAAHDANSDDDIS